MNIAFQYGLYTFIGILGIGLIISFIKRPNKKSKIIKRIEDHQNFSEEDILEEIKRSKENNIGYINYIMPVVRRNKTLFNKLVKTLGIDIEKIQKKVIRSNKDDIDAEQIVLMKVAGVFVFIFLLLTLPFAMGGLGIPFAGVIFAYLYFVPESKLDDAYNKRKRQVRDTMPNFLKLMADATSTGHTVSDAIVRVSRKYPCVLSEEFLKVEKETKYSNDWDIALENMAYKNDIDDIHNLVTEILITKQRGTSITEVLLKHAEKIETETVLNITEDARKKAATIIFPIFGLLFIPLLVLMLMPALQTVMNSL